MAATLVRFHVPRLYHRTYPSPKGEGFTDPLSGTLKELDPDWSRRRKLEEAAEHSGWRVMYSTELNKSVDKNTAIAQYRATIGEICD